MKTNIISKLIIILIAASTFLISPRINAETFIKRSEAINHLFPGAKSKKEVKQLTSAQKKEILSSYDWNVKKSSFTFYNVKKAGKLVGRYVFLSEKGKHGAIWIAVGINLNGSVKKVVVCSLKEIRGKPVKSRMFLKQFSKKTLKSKLTVGKDIQGITSATLSSIAVASATKKALILHSVFYE